MENIFITFAIFFALRLMTLGYSIRNEKSIKKRGGIEYGKGNSLLLTIAHVAFYGSALYEAYITNASFDTFSYIGITFMLFAYLVLFHVIYKLHDIWTVKVYIVPNHRIERSFLFKHIKHPNYFLNIIPELIGTAFLCHAWRTFVVLFPLYCILLFVRIRQEEKAMHHLI